LRLEHLIGLLLRPELDQKRLVDALQCRHLGVLCRVRGMAHRLQVRDVLLPLLRVGADGTEGLDSGRVGRVAEIRARTLGSDSPLPLRIELAITGELADTRNADLLSSKRCPTAGRNRVDPTGGIAVGVGRWRNAHPLLGARLEGRIQHGRRVRHLLRQVVVVDDVLHLLARGGVKLYALMDLFDGVTRLHPVNVAELRVNCRRSNGRGSG
jgi:hypothetical protein